MLYIYKGEELGSLFGLSTNYPQDKDQLSTYNNLISIHWNRLEEEITFFVDGLPRVLQPQQITTTTYLENISFLKKTPSLTTFTFNRPFYCIQDHDYEVSCNGIIFLGTQTPPIITLGEAERNKFDTLYQVFLEEFQTTDNIQGEMLTMLLKRLIIKVTRLAKKQLIPKEVNDSQIDIIRKYNVLVDLHFKTKRQVSDYAEMLFKSPKTLSNLFAKYNQKTPLQIIHERTVLEAKRLLMYTEKTVKEIAYDLGFEETGTFHKLFKKVTGQTPQQFKSAYQK